MKINRDLADAFNEEAELRAKLDSIVTIKCELEKQIEESPKAKESFLSRINLLKKAELNSVREKHMSRVMQHRKRVFDLRTELLELQNKIDVLVHAQLQENNAPELRENLEITGFYGLSYKRITAFQVCLRQFLVKLGSARAAMSASYKKDQESYSASTQKSMQEAKSASRELDGAILNINGLSREFENKGFGARVTLTLLPRFNERGYENLIMEAFLLVIALAHPELENILNDCEELDTKEISAAYLVIEDAQKSHKEQTDILVRKIWQQAQHKHLSENDEAL